ncbi:MAG: peptidoglycan-binding protein, partial [Thermoleophilia bacterium]|nr:peptidoglycan-binding protein [Thermoleophilia bacterium]
MTLGVSTTGAAVVRAKTRLRALHYAVDRGATVTSQTRDAIMAFQKLNGLQRDGVVGAQTLRAM